MLLSAFSVPGTPDTHHDLQGAGLILQGKLQCSAHGQQVALPACGYRTRPTDCQDGRCLKNYKHRDWKDGLAARNTCRGVGFSSYMAIISVLRDLMPSSGI